MYARLRGPNNLSIFHQIINRTYFPCLADEIDEPRPDMNIKVTAFKESKTFYYMTQCYLAMWVVPGCGI